MFACGTRRGQKVQRNHGGRICSEETTGALRFTLACPEVCISSWTLSGPLLSFLLTTDCTPRSSLPLLSPRCAQIRQDNDYLDKKESSVYLYKCITLWVLLIATCLAIWWCFVHEVNAEIRQVQLTNSSTSLPYNAYNQQHTTVTRTSMNNSTHTAQRASTTNLVDIHEHVLDKGSQKILTDRAEILAHAFSNRGSSFY